MILASETISKRNNFPVELQCRLYSTASREIEWCVKCAGQSQCFNTFEETAEYIRKRKFLSPTKLKTIGSTKSRLLEDAEYKLAELDRIEAIRNTAEYKGAVNICEIRQQLKLDGVANSERDANMLILLHYLRAEH